MNSIVNVVITLIQALLPNLSVSTTVQNILNALIEILPFVIKEYQDVLPEIKNIIAALSDSDAVTPEQLVALKQLDAQVDAAFEAAVTDIQAS